MVQSSAAADCCGGHNHHTDTLHAGPQILLKLGTLNKPQAGKPPEVLHNCSNESPSQQNRPCSLQQIGATCRCKAQAGPRAITKRKGTSEKAPLTNRCNLLILPESKHHLKPLVPAAQNLLLLLNALASSPRAGYRNQQTQTWPQAVPEPHRYHPALLLPLPTHQLAPSCCQHHQRHQQQ